MFPLPVIPGGDGSELKGLIYKELTPGALLTGYFPPIFGNPRAAVHWAVARPLLWVLLRRDNISCSYLITDPCAGNGFLSFHVVPRTRAMPKTDLK